MQTNQNARSEVVGWLEDTINTQNALDFPSAASASSSATATTTTTTATATAAAPTSSTTSPSTAKSDGGSTASASGKWSRLLVVYFVALIQNRVRLSHAESMALGRLHLSTANVGNLLSHALRQRQVFCSIELGDLLYSGGDLKQALAVFVWGFVPDRVARVLVELGSFETAVQYVLPPPLLGRATLCPSLCAAQLRPTFDPIQVLPRRGVCCRFAASSLSSECFTTHVRLSPLVLMCGRLGGLACVGSHQTGVGRDCRFASGCGTPQSRGAACSRRRPHTDCEGSRCERACRCRSFASHPRTFRTCCRCGRLKLHCWRT